MYEVVSKHHVK